MYIHVMSKLTVKTRKKLKTAYNLKSSPAEYLISRYNQRLPSNILYPHKYILEFIFLSTNLR
jgi:hypothetical protein